MDTEGTADVQGMSDVQRTYIDDLKELRKEYGCTPERNALYAILRKRVVDKQQQPHTYECIAELKTIIVQGLGNIERRDALLAALGLIEEYPGRILVERRRKYLERLEVERHLDIRTCSAGKIGLSLRWQSC
jgi:hypothetical protein